LVGSSQISISNNSTPQKSSITSPPVFVNSLSKYEDAKDELAEVLEEKQMVALSKSKIKPSVG
jgi:hypothetical protein